MTAPLDAEGRRLLWRCRRGVKELDVLLERYAGAALAQPDGRERRVLARLLDLPDPELAGYLLGGAAPADAELAALTGRIRGDDGGPRGMVDGRVPAGPAQSEDI